eukprot:3072962-Prymnesium_polylepis.1
MCAAGPIAVLPALAAAAASLAAIRPVWCRHHPKRGDAAVRDHVRLWPPQPHGSGTRGRFGARGVGALAQLGCWHQCSG